MCNCAHVFVCVGHCMCVCMLMNSFAFECVTRLRTGENRNFNMADEPICVAFLPSGTAAAPCFSMRLWLRNVGSGICRAIWEFCTLFLPLHQLTSHTSCNESWLNGSNALRITHTPLDHSSTMPHNDCDSVKHFVSHRSAWQLIVSKGVAYLSTHSPWNGNGNGRQC